MISQMTALHSTFSPQKSPALRSSPVGIHIHGLKACTANLALIKPWTRPPEIGPVASATNKRIGITALWHLAITIPRPGCERMPCHPASSHLAIARTDGIGGDGVASARDGPQTLGFRNSKPGFIHYGDKTRGQLHRGTKYPCTTPGWPIRGQ